MIITKQIQKAEVFKSSRQSMGRELTDFAQGRNSM